MLMRYLWRQIRAQNQIIYDLQEAVRDLRTLSMAQPVKGVRRPK